MNYNSGELNLKDYKQRKKLSNSYIGGGDFMYKLLNGTLRGTYDPFAFSYISIFAQDLLALLKYLSKVLVYKQGAQGE